MRKVFTILVGMFLVIAALLILLVDTNRPSSISILTINQNYQRLMTENEELSITVYISSKDCFLIDKTNIENLYLKDETNEMEVGISDVRYLEYSETYQNTKYFAFVFDINFQEITVNNFILELENGYLVLHYLNGEIVNLEIGDVTLNFMEFDNPNYIDINRMFALYKENNFEYISAIVLDFFNKTGMDISITHIDINNKDVSLDLDNAIQLSEIPSYQADIDELLGYNYNPIGEEENSGVIDLNQLTYIVIPLKYKSAIERLNRFPLIVDFTYNQQTYQYTVDDFQFNSQSMRLEANSGRIREFIYYY